MTELPDELSCVEGYDGYRPDIFDSEITSAVYDLFVLLDDVEMHNVVAYSIPQGYVVTADVTGANHEGYEETKHTGVVTLRTRNLEPPVTE